MIGKLDKKKVIALAIILVLAITIFFITQPKNCEKDDSCFNTFLQKCSKAKIITTSNEDTFKYEILGKKENTCIIETTLLKVSENKPVELKQALEGRSMRCAIPKEIILEKQINEIGNLSNYCTGSLKEAILQITIDKLYEIIVKNIGPITTEFKNLVKS